MVLLGVQDEAELHRWAEKITTPKAIFREPDIGNQATAMAVSPETGSEMFRSLRLL